MRSSRAATETQHSLMVIINILFKKEVTLFEETKEREESIFTYVFYLLPHDLWDSIKKTSS